MSVASLAFSGALAPWRSRRDGGSQIAAKRASGRATCVVVRARVSGGPETEESRWIPPPAFPGENREENRGKVRPARAREPASPRHPKNRAVGPELINSSRPDRLDPAPRSPLAETPIPLPALPQSWGKTIKMALAGVAIAGASLVAPRRAHALPDAVVNGGMAAAGATAASYLLKTTVGRGNSAAALAPPATAATVAEALVVAAEEASSSSS